MDRKFVFSRIEKNIAIVEMSNEKKKMRYLMTYFLNLKIHSKK